MDGKAAIAKVLKAEGVDFVTCFPYNPIIDAVAAEDIRPILTRTERVAVGILRAEHTAASEREAEKSCCDILHNLAFLRHVGRAWLQSVLSGLQPRAHAWREFSSSRRMNRRSRLSGGMGVPSSRHSRNELAESVGSASVDNLQGWAARWSIEELPRIAESPAKLS